MRKRILSQYYSVMAYKYSGTDQRLHRRGAAGGRPTAFIIGSTGLEFRARRHLRHPADDLGRGPVPFLGGRQRPVGRQQALSQIHAGVLPSRSSGWSWP